MMNLKEVLNTIANVSELVVEQWLNHELSQMRKKIRQKRFKTLSFYHPEISHPLIWVWNQAEKNIQELRRGSNKIHTELFELVNLGESIRKIEGTDVISMNGKYLREKTVQKRLRKELRDSKLYEKTAYVLRVAASYCKNRNHVSFIEESSDKTPDLRIAKDDTHVYIECKRKNEQTKRDKGQMHICNELSRILWRYMQKVGKNYFISVKARRDFRKGDIPYLKKLITETIDIGKDTRFIDSTETFALTLTKTLEKDQTIITKGFNISTDLDYGIFDVNYMQKGENLYVKNPQCIAFGTQDLPDRIKGVIQAFDTAYKQIPQKGPGLIYIDIFPSKMIKSDFMRLRDQLYGKLAVIKRVNAVIISATVSTTELSDVSNPSCVSQILCNKNPRTTLPKIFRIQRPYTSMLF